MKIHLLCLLLVACGSAKVGAGGKCATTDSCGPGLFCSTGKVCTSCTEALCGAGGTGASFTLGGTVTGLTGTLVLTDAAESLSVTKNGAFVFAGPITGGGSYAVSVKAQPAAETCTVQGGTGTITSNVTNIVVTCVAANAGPFAVQGSVFGLDDADSVGISNNNANPQTLTAASNTFSFIVADGSPYAISVSTPAVDSNCTVVSSVVNGTGTMSGANVTGIVITCTSAVQPYYAAAPNWLDWVKGDVNGDALPPPGNATCAGTETGWHACVPAGELRFVDVPGVPSCDGWTTAADSLSAFNWICQSNGDHIAFASTGLNPNKHLSDLVTFGATGAFSANSFTASNGTDTLTTPASVWWNDAFPALDAGGCQPSSGAVPGIYLIQKNCSEPWTTLLGKVAIVIQPGFTETTDNAVLAGGIGEAHFAWIEGHFDGDFNASPVISVLSDFYVLDNVTATSADGGGIAVSANNVYLRHVAAYLNNPGVSLSGYFNVLRDVIAASNAPGEGIVVASPGAGDSLFDGVRVYDNARAGLVFGVSGDIAGNVNGGDVVINSIAGANQSFGFEVFNDNMTIIASTSVANGDVGVLLRDGGSSISNPQLISSAVIDNTSQGVFLASSTDALLAADVATSTQLFANGSQNADYLLVSTVTSTLQSLVAGFHPTLGPNVVDCTTNLEQLCPPQASFISIASGDPTTYFVPEVKTLAQANIFDWASPTGTSGAAFANTFTFWASDGSSLAATTPGPCATADCGLWDVSLAKVANNDLLGNTASAGGSFFHQWDLTSAAGSEATICATLAGPGAYASGPKTCTTTALLFAAEIYGDGIGNDNGLCENNENCILLRNAGAYQGSGALVPATPPTYNAAGITANLFVYANNGQ